MSRLIPRISPFTFDLQVGHLGRVQPIQRVIDAGSGDGNFTALLAKRVFEIYGIDQSPRGIAKAMQRYPNIRFSEGSVYDDFNTEFGVSSFDAIVCIEAIEPLYSPRLFVRRSYAALRPDGILIVSTRYWRYLKNLVFALINCIDRALTSLWDGGHIKHWSLKMLRRLLVEQGFELVAFHGSGRKIPYLWSGMMIAVRKPAGPAGVGR